MAGIAACVVVLLSKGGHPPAIVLLPIVIVVWLLGHFILWFSQWLVRRSARSIFAEQDMRQGWPAAIILLVVVAGILALASAVLSIILIVRSGMENQAIAPLAVMLISTLLFIGLLMRKNWVRFILLVLLAVLGTWPIFEMGHSALRGYPHPVGDWLIAIGITLLLLGFMLYLLKSKRIRGYFGTR